jgi:hypothetical protein
LPLLALLAVTTVTVFTPWSSSGLRAEYAVTAHAKGSCWTNSSAANRPDAWRCMVGNDIHDPCFIAPGGRRVACTSDPFAERVVLIDLAKPLKVTGAAMPVSEMNPWALRLSGGARCELDTGATGGIAGMRLNYACSDGGWILDYPSRSHPLWKAHYVRGPHDSKIEMVDVDSAVL